MSNRKKIEQVVTEFSDEWFDEENYDAFVSVGVRLLEAGINLVEVEEMLSKLFYAVKDEYGE